MTKFFKGKGAKKEVKPVPRENAAILEDYNVVKARAGEVQYLIHAYEKELGRLNAHLESLNYESDARKTLDKEKEGTSEQARG